MQNDTSNTPLTPLQRAYAAAAVADRFREPEGLVTIIPPVAGQFRVNYNTIIAEHPYLGLLAMLGNSNPLGDGPDGKYLGPGNFFKAVNRGNQLRYEVSGEAFMEFLKLVAYKRPDVTPMDLRAEFIYGLQAVAGRLPDTTEVRSFRSPPVLDLQGSMSDITGFSLSPAYFTAACEGFERVMERLYQEQQRSCDTARMRQKNIEPDNIRPELHGIGHKLRGLLPHKKQNER